MPAGSKPVAISFLVAAHNEEKKIDAFLRQLRGAVTDGVEVLLGFDGCTDRTADIARQHTFARLFEYKERRGKSMLLNDLVKKAQGEVVIVCDVDWDVLVKDGWQEDILALFSDVTLGGIVLPTANLPSIDWQYLDRMSLAFRGEAWGSHFMNRYQIATQTQEENGRRYVDPKKMSFPFTVNICRKKAVGDFVTAGDDFERCLQVLKNGYRLLMDESGVFIFRATDIEKTLKDMFRQRTRGSTVYPQLQQHYGYQAALGRFMLSETVFAISKVLSLRIKDIVALQLWYVVAALAFLYSGMQHAETRSTEELWKLRAER